MESSWENVMVSYSIFSMVYLFYYNWCVNVRKNHTNQTPNIDWKQWLVILTVTDIKWTGQVVMSLSVSIDTYWETPSVDI